MDEHRYNYYEDDMEIDLIDLMFYLLKRWRGLIIAIVLGLVLGLGIYLVKDQQQKAKLVAQTAAMESADETEEFDESKYDISDDVEANMELAYQYRQLYRKQLEYNQKSIIMQLDPNAVYTGELKYYLTAGYDTGLVSVLYQSILSDKDLLTELQEASGLDCDVPYIKELIDSGVSKENDADININNLMSNLTDSVASVTKNAFVSYKVVSTSEQSCEKMIQVIREKVQELDARCQENYAGYSAVEVADSVRKVTDNSYLNQQKSNIDQLNNYLSNVQKLENALTDEEKEFYFHKYLTKEFVSQDEDEKLTTAVVDEAEPVSKVKWLVLGIFLGICVWGLYGCCRYLMDGSVKTTGEVQRLTHLPVIGCYQDVTVKKNKIDQAIMQLQSKVIGKRESLDYIGSLISAMKQGNCLISSESAFTETSQVVEKLKEYCSEMQVAEYSSKSADSLNTARNIGREILVVSTGKTKRSDLERELEVCGMQNIKVSGLIVVKNM